MRKQRLILFDLALAISGSIGSGLMFLLFDKVAWWWTVLIVTAFVLVVVLLIFQRLSWEEKGSEQESQLSEARRHQEEELWRERFQETHLLQNVVDSTTGILRVACGTLRGLVKRLPQGGGPAGGQTACLAKPVLPEIVKSLQDTVINETLKSIVDIFKSDPRGVETTKRPHTWFKAALFQVVDKNGATWLKRTHFVYPSGVEPHAESAEVQVETESRYAHVLSYLSQDIQLLEDIQTEMKKPRSTTRWRDLYDNQHVDYASMACFPIVVGERDAPDRKVLGILVVDTNRESYFKEKDRDYLAFLGTLLGPFRSTLTLVLSLDDHQKRICGP